MTPRALPSALKPGPLARNIIRYFISKYELRLVLSYHFTIPPCFPLDTRHSTLDTRHSTLDTRHSTLDTRHSTLPISLSPYLPYLPISLSPYLPISLSPYLPISLSPYLPISLSPYLPISLSPYLPISLSPYLPSHPVMILYLGCLASQ